MSEQEDECQSRFTCTRLAQEDFDKIVEAAANRAVEKMKKDFYSDVGEMMVKKVFWVVGVGTFAVFVALVKLGIIKSPF